MSLSSSHQSHMNITESRRHAVKLMTRETGMQYFLNGEKIGKGKMLTYVNMGYFDGFFYGVNYTHKEVRVSNLELFHHKIGN